MLVDFLLIVFIASTGQLEAGTVRELREVKGKSQEGMVVLLHNFFLQYVTISEK